MGRETLPAELTPAAITEWEYDRAAATYDAVTSASPTDLAENVVVGRLMRALRDRAPLPGLLDLGCGTGLCVDLVQPEPEWYVGIDLSHGMLAEAEAKYPGYTFLHGDMLDELRFAPQRSTGLIVSTFGSPSHVHPLRLPLLLEGIGSALDIGGFAFLMFETKPAAVTGVVKEAPLYASGEWAVVSALPDGLEVESITGLTWAHRKPPGSHRSVRAEVIRLRAERALRILPVQSSNWMIVVLRRG